MTLPPLGDFTVEGFLQELKEAAEEEKANKKKKDEALALKPLVKVPKSIPFSSHDKGGKFGGASPYTDKDVAEAREYMQEVMGISAMSVGGRDLAHILAEVRAFAIQESYQEISQLKVKAGKAPQLEVKIAQYRKSIDEQIEMIDNLKDKIKELQEFQVAAKKIHKGEVAEVSTGRRIKE